MQRLGFDHKHSLDKSYAEAIRRGKVLDESWTSAKGNDIRGSRVLKESRSQGLMQQWPSVNITRLGKNQGSRPPWKGRKGAKQVWLPVRRDLPPKGIGTSAEVAIKGPGTQEKVPMVRVETVGNGWLYRSAVATFAEDRSTEFLFESFMNNNSGRYFITRRLDNKKVLITFQSEEEMTSFIEQHNNQNFYWFRSVEPWSVSTVCSFGREIWIVCYGVPVDAWNIGTFCSIGKHWGEVVQIDEDTAKGARFDVGKVKVFTQMMSAINQMMHLMVGSKLYPIRVSEEQAVFICNSDFRCECTCYGKEDKETPSQLLSDEDDDVAEGGDVSLLDSEDMVSRSFIAETREAGEEIIVGDRLALGEVFEEPEGYSLTHMDRANSTAHHLETCMQACAGQSGNQNSGPGNAGPSRGLHCGPDSYLGSDSLHSGGLTGRMGDDVLRTTNLNLGLSGHRGLDSLVHKEPSGESQKNTTAEPVVMSRPSGDAVFIPEGINLEVVLIGDSSHAKLSSTVPEIQEGRIRSNEDHCASMDGSLSRRSLAVAGLATSGNDTEVDRQLQANMAQ
ncbi:hypothetical protein Dimus_029573 [Dionaea muscipula]